jgi:hypothetical protein
MSVCTTLSGISLRGLFIVVLVKGTDLTAHFYFYMFTVPVKRGDSFPSHEVFMLDARKKKPHTSIKGCAEEEREIILSRISPRASN